MLSRFLVSLSVFVIFSECEGEKFQVKTILERKDSLTPPCVNGSDQNAVNVNITFGILSIGGINERRQSLSLSFYIVLKWRDEDLTWTPDINKPQNIYFPLKHIWTPTISIKEALDGNILLVDRGNGMVELQSNGCLILPLIRFVETSCSMDIRRFPFDIQVCHISFSRYLSNINLIVEEIFKDSFGHDNNEWEIIQISFHKLVMFYSEFEAAEAKLTLKRLPLFHVLKSVVPSILLSFVNGCVFLLPAESGERMAMSISSFLAYAIYVTFIYDSLPANSGAFAYFPVYLCTMTFQSGMIIVATLVSLRIHYPEKRKILRNKVRIEPEEAGGEEEPDFVTCRRKFDIRCFISCVLITTVATFCLFYYLLVD